MTAAVGTTVAAIDCGTNSIRLYVARQERDGLIELTREMRIVRLGQGVDATGRFADEALDRVRAALDDYVDTALRLGAGAVRMVATSAARDVSNRDTFLALTAAALGRITPGAQAEVIAGTEEAELSYLGATAGLSATDPVLVVDLGGGSTELVSGSAGVVADAYSANIGCVRITERALPSDPPTDAEIAAARGVIDAALDQATEVVPLTGVRTWIGVAGTFTTLAALDLGLADYDPARIHGARVPLDRLVDLCARLVGMPSAQRLALGPMHPGRADVIGGGALVVIALAERLAAAGVTELMVSEHDILDGVAIGLLRG
ncbi:Ppx/GppA phosphatase OS=Tsukamurella paurometabola (strain ATCC 8368 / DSM / CCUG 35730 / CIP 100753 / JCM 10117 / KCTC 9821 / NBRC 16120 / NCIMB 702349/ NCTC 13040) OX=521096 GN=Tpau_3162 PE=4 SV=1 [Tsukamurella paurometabola]|uniref:Ppx/GppA phosphatase n=1 Tax=Tsukamurella paurometabola (strain ATCC 8368 / DSM 20162 / CCUG 35730 / CIP 100753 / JCM 10117 / KCTC 9821 / NBRC 16120 / NCIMB 702349 / NCTC 13040) TaxID=521096 RepID=D5UV31_TSUPD|nr:Ppx/GppA phosphatase family protein [Tsukamurella paurometabola]ADG79749.1 Ppx/GppA phosphatase [Tsukamurella paurometabola DSM 20162]SUP37043.1 Guanosine-5'-triphosphate,3'-diphosphate pyrophosphatase [Tsukamurella paurometabola]